MGVELEGNPKKPEPIHFRVVLPTGCIDIARCENGDYWIHVNANNPERGDLCPGEFQPGYLIDARLHSTNIFTSEANLGDFADPGLYDVALRISKQRTTGETPEAS